MASTPYTVTVPLTTYEAPGAVVGQSALDTVGFYGGAGAAQSAGAQQAALSLSAIYLRVKFY